MTSRYALSLWILTVGASLLLGACGASPDARQQAEQPNIILIMADDLGYEVLGANGGTSYQTPRLDQLARDGIRFTRAHSTPLCTPSRVQIMTGKYGFRNYVEFGFLDPAQTTFGNLLQDAGYHTAVAGKWQLQFDDDPDTPHGFGFHEYLLWQRKTGDFWYRYKHPVVAGSEVPRDTLFGRYGPDVFAGFIEDFVERHQDHRPDEPFFVYYPMVLVHDPFQPPPGTEGFETHDVVGLNDTTYFRDITAYMDRTVGRLVDHLDDLGIRDETLLIFTGDNGTDRDVVSRMGDRVVPGGKGLPIKTGTHVPLIASWPGTIEAATSDALVDFTDFVPTLMDAAGAGLPATFVTDGHSFLPLLLGQAAPEREWIFCDYDGKDGQFPAGRWAQDEQFKLYDDGRFYDYRADAMEENSLNTATLTGAAREAFDMLSEVHERMDAADGARTASDSH